MVPTLWLLTFPYAIFIIIRSPSFVRHIPSIKRKEKIFLTPILQLLMTTQQPISDHFASFYILLVPKNLTALTRRQPTTGVQTVTSQRGQCSSKVHRTWGQRSKPELGKFLEKQPNFIFKGHTRKNCSI